LAEAGAPSPELAHDRLRSLIDRFSEVTILVVGDVMLDRFLIGRVTRISPEAPVPVVAFDHEMQRIGGAANVAHNIRALGGRVELVGVTGRDEAGDRLLSACRDAGIRTTLIADESRPTTTKVRVVTERNQQVARIDYERDAEVTGVVEEGVATELRRRGQHVSAIVVSDYLKGSVTRRVVSEAVSVAGARSIPLLIDPKIPHLEYYAGAAVITPNHHEAEAATHLRVRTDEDARDVAREFRARAKCRGVVMTRGDQGMWVLDDRADRHLPASAREVADVTGAGDTVIATLALAMAAGGTLFEAASIANRAAGIVVAKFGPATVSPAELLHSLDTPAAT
jgi:D-beta-D-heptose 7-phosphate kinase/D-beta-D-heptose 1-phosphate adenosyltransferase